MAFRVTETALSQIPGLVAATAFMLLAVWLVYLDPRSRPIRVFALLIALRGVGNFLGGLASFFGDFGTSKTFGVVSISMFTVLPFVAVYFISVYPYRRGWFGTSRFGYWSLVGTALILLAVYLLDPTLNTTFEPRPDGTARGVAAGPLRILSGLLWLIYAVMVFILVRDYARTPVRPLRRSILLVAMGFGLHVTVQASTVAYRWVTNSLGVQPITGVFVDTSRAFFVLAFFVSLSTIFYLARLLRAQTEPGERRLLSFWLVALTMAIILTPLSIIMSPAPNEPGFRYDTVLLGVVSLALPILVAYALVKHQMFDIDLKIKWTIKSGTIAGAFVAVFLVAAQLAQNFFGQVYGWALGGVTAGLLLFALAPIQRVAERFANAAMPHVQNTEEWRSNRKADCYKAAVAVALKDRVVTLEEERMLAMLADELGIGAMKALELREDVKRQMGVGPRAGRSPTG